MSFGDKFVDFIEPVMTNVVLPIILIMLLAIVFIGIPYLGYVFYIQEASPTFSLRKADWSCTKVYEYTTHSMLMVGKVMVPRKITHRDCIEWSHK